jgi:tripartite-type tricarboxylate transporter receptor subunit TctC
VHVPYRGRPTSHHRFDWRPIRDAVCDFLIGKALARPDLRQQLALQGIDVIGGTPEQFAEHVRKETAKWADLIRRSGAKAD